MNPKTTVPRTILKGLAVILPAFILGLFLYWLIDTLESTLAKVFLFVFPDRLYFPGLGLGLFIVICFCVGLLMSTIIAQRLFNVWDHLLQRVPLIKTLYGAVEDIIASFSADRTKRFNRVVLVEFKDLHIKLLGYVTREDLSVLPKGFGGPDEIMVYLPMSYQIGGYMIVVPRSLVEPLDITVEDASRLVITAGMSVRRQG